MFEGLISQVRSRVSLILLFTVGPAALYFIGSNCLIAAQHKIPNKSGQVFVVDDWDNKITKNDLGFNYFSGNTGAVEFVEGTTTITVSNESNGSIGGSLDISFDFTGVSNEYAGYFASLFGLTDTKISLDGSGVEPNTTTPFPGCFLDTHDIYRGFSMFPNRSVEELRFDVLLESSDDITLKIELKDENDFDVFAYRTIKNTGDIWQTISLRMPDDFNNSVKGGGNTSQFNWRQVSTFTIIVEHHNIGNRVNNPDKGRFLIDNLVLVDTDGNYPDLNQIRSSTGGLDPNYQGAFLDLIRATSCLYFLDWASNDLRTGGIVQDRSTFADLMTVGGVGFQLSSYIIDAERGYLSREVAALRVRNILRVLYNHPQGTDRIGTIGYKGFFYHFLGTDGLRKLNFDFKETPDIDESLNTVELSTIDTALAIAGVVTAGQYFNGNSDIEKEIQNLANQIYACVDWKFMLDDSRFTNTKQFFLGWKPNEPRDDDSGHFGRYKLNDDPYNPRGQYSSKKDNGAEIPATLDYYTDEGLLIALLAMSSPDPNHRLGREVWDAMIRDDENGPFVKTYPGSLFTYQFASVWLDTQLLGTDNHPIKPVNFFENTRKAIQATRNYAIANPNGHATPNENRWGFSATEGPFDTYFAEAAPPAAIHPGGNEPMAYVFGSGGPILLEGESGTGDGSIMQRSNASGLLTRWLHSGETFTLDFNLSGTATYDINVCYSNDNYGPLETVEVKIDGISVGSFAAQDTGNYGYGWNNFFNSGTIGSKILAPGNHQVSIFVSGGDGYGVEIDFVKLEPKPVLRPLEVGTVTNYSIGSSIVHAPTEAIAGLWNNTQHEDLNYDGTPDLLHPRFGFADAFNLNVADAVIEGEVHPNESRILRADGAWINYTGFAIDHGPMLIMIDNYLNGQFIPHLFMSHSNIRGALSQLFALHLVPNIVGMESAQANTAITSVDNLKVGTITTAYSNTVAAGKIISQNPAAGTVVATGSAVNYVKSLGKPIVPNIVGKTAADANMAVVNANLAVGTITTAYSNTVAAGKVISQNPIAGTAVMIGSVVSYVKSLGKSVIVPNIAGMVASNANIAVVNANLVVGTITTAYSNTVAAGKVISQNPVAGTVVATGSAVNYVKSLGKPIVPNVVGMAAADANTAITSVDNLKVGTITTTYSNTVAAGKVISQNPAAGTVVATGSKVNYVKSLGRPIVPNIVGKTSAQANTAITSVDNLKVGTVTTAYSNTVAAGKVISQNPAAGTAVATGSAVNYVKSLGKPIVPNIVGKTSAQANTAITSVDNLKVGTVTTAYSNTVAAGKVISQNPAAGTAVATGSAVNYVKSLGKPIVPNIVGMTVADANTAITSVDNLKVGTVTTAYSNTVAAGKIISQNPVAGTAVVTGSAVNYVKSLGRK